MCKHVAAALYGVGARLDDNPMLFFELRGIEVGHFIDVTLASQKPRRNQRGIKFETPQGAGYLTLAAVAKCLQAATWLVARGNKVEAMLANVDTPSSRIMGEDEISG